MIPEGPGSKFIIEVYNLTKGFPLVKHGFEAPESGYLRNQRHVTNTSDVEALLGWFTPEVVTQLPESSRRALRRHLQSQITRRGKMIETHEKERLSQLPIFERLVVGQSTGGPVLTYSISSIKLIIVFHILHYLLPRGGLWQFPAWMFCL